MMQLKRGQVSSRLLMWLSLAIVVVLTVGCESDSKEAQAADFNGTEAVLGNMRGEVSVNRDGEWIAVGEGESIAAGQSIRTGSLAHVWLSFPDDSKAFLGPETQVRLVELAVAQNMSDRIVRLQQERGETHHVVVPSGAGSAVYEVETAKADSSSNDGTFSVYAGEDTRVAVSEGTVQCTTAGATHEVNAGTTISLAEEETVATRPLIVEEKGTVDEIGETWIIAGREFVVDAETVVADDLQPGDVVYVEAYVREDGPPVALFIADAEHIAQDDVDRDVDEEDDDGVDKVTICHRPPGNPDNEHTLTIGEPAVDAHLAHGDTIGVCPTGEGPGDQGQNNKGKSRGNNE